MAGDSSREHSIKRINIRSLAVLGALFGLVAGLVSVAIIMAMLAGVNREPEWIELSAGMLSLKRPYPIEPWLIYLWHG